MVLAARRVDEHEPARARTRERRLGGERHQHRGHRGVDRIAAGPENVGASLGGAWVPGCHNPFHGADAKGYVAGFATAVYSPYPIRITATAASAT